MPPTLAGVCVGSLSALYLRLAFQMSIRRVRGAKGQGNPKSKFEKHHNIQLLTAEYVPIITALILYLELRRSTAKNNKDTPEGDARHAGWVKAAMVMATAGCFVFARRAYDLTVDAHGYNMRGAAGDGVVSRAGYAGAWMKYLGIAGLCAAAVTR